MSKRHQRQFFYITNREADRPPAGGAFAAAANPGVDTERGGGVMRGEVDREPTTAERQRSFRFSEMVVRNAPENSDELLRALAAVMSPAGLAPPITPADLSGIPAGFTYLGQFLDHDLTKDVTDVPLETPLAGANAMMQGRSPALDLDSLYGAGPGDPNGRMFYQTDGVRLALGRTSEMPFQLPNAIAAANNKARDGFDLPRFGSETADPLEAHHAKIPDVRNDENLAVGQTHLLFMRFHNRVVDHLSKTTPSVELFDRARETVVKHYQWMVWHDHLPQIVDPAILDDVMANGRKVFEPNAAGFPTMPIEFSVAAYRLGHSMIRPEYDWNAMFGPTTPAAPARLDRGTLDNLFRFSGTSGNLSPFASAPPPQASDLDNPIDGSSETLPNIWVADWTRLFDFAADGHATPALADNATLNHAMVIDIHLTNPLANLPLGSFDNDRKKVSDPMHLNLAFRNLARGKMVKLASGQDVEADFGVDPLLPAQILGNHFVNLPAVLSGLVANGALSLPEGKSDSEQDMKQWADSLTDELASNTPLWYYCLREAELHGSTPNANGNKLGPVGGRIVAETFHRAIQGSRISFLREVGFEPTLNRDILGVPAGNPAANQFRMTDMVKIAFDHSKGELPLF